MAAATNNSGMHRYESLIPRWGVLWDDSASAMRSPRLNKQHSDAIWYVVKKNYG